MDKTQEKVDAILRQDELLLKEKRLDKVIEFAEARLAVSRGAAAKLEILDRLTIVESIRLATHIGVEQATLDVLEKAKGANNALHKNEV